MRRQGPALRSMRVTAARVRSPTSVPTAAPTLAPTPVPTPTPTAVPTLLPTTTLNPTPLPSAEPTATAAPTVTFPFTEHVINATALAPVSLAVLDFDGDTDFDVVAGGGSNTAWFKNDDLSFQAIEVASVSGLGIYCVHAADLDGDGDTDVVSADRSADTVSWYENTGDTSFEVFTVSSSQLAMGVFAVDLDGDADTDVVFSSEYDGP